MLAKLPRLVHRSSLDEGKHATTHYSATQVAAALSWQATPCVAVQCSADLYCTANLYCTSHTTLHCTADLYCTTHTTLRSYGPQHIPATHSPSTTASITLSSRSPVSHTQQLVMSRTPRSEPKHGPWYSLHRAPRAAQRRPVRPAPHATVPTSSAIKTKKIISSLRGSVQDKKNRKSNCKEL